MSPATAIKTRYHHGDLRSTLLDAASKLLEEQGASALSLRAVAKLAGVSHAAPYRHFRDKTALLEAIAARGFECLGAAVEAASSRYPGDPERQLIEGGAAYVEQVVCNPQRAHLMFGGIVDCRGPSPVLRPAAEASAATFLDLVRAGQKAKLFKPAPTREIVLSVWSVVHGLAMLQIGRQLAGFELGGDPKALSRLVGRNIFHGLLREPAEI